MDKNKGIYDVLLSGSLKPNLVFVSVVLIIILALLIFDGKHHRITVNQLGTFETNIPDTSPKIKKVVSRVGAP